MCILYPHPDYLGNTEFVTDLTGRPYQHWFYSPFGEELVGQKALLGDYDSPYRFNAKEVDPETGLHYYGARYYNSNLSLWISVDPLADKYPSLNPYNFVANNPVMLIDPDGMRIAEGAKKLWNSFRTNVENRLSSLTKSYDKKLAKADRKGWDSEKIEEKTGDLVERINSLSNSLNDMTLMENDENHTFNLVPSDSRMDEIMFNPESGNIDLYVGNTAGFVHESAHGGQFLRGEIAFSKSSGKGFTDLYDEVGAYKAQFAYDPYSVSKFSSNPNFSSSNINVDFILSIDPAYKDHGQVNYDIYSPGCRVREAYPGGAGDQLYNRKDVYHH